MARLPGQSETPMRVQDIERRLKEGIASVAASFGKALDDLSTRIIQQVQGAFYSKGDSDARYASKVHQHAGSDIVSGTLGIPVNTSGAVQSGSLSTGSASVGSLSSSGGVSGTQGTFPTGLSSTGAYNRQLTSSYKAGYIDSGGNFGFAPSSRRYKQDIVPAEIDPNAILALEVVHFHYIAEVRKRDDPDYPDYVGPEYTVRTELGLIAEELDARGLSDFVLYQQNPIWIPKTRTVPVTRPLLDDEGNPVLDEDGNPTIVTEYVEEHYQVYGGDTAVLNADGKPIPDGVRYDLLALATIPVLQDHERRIAALENRGT